VTVRCVFFPEQAIDMHVHVHIHCCPRASHRAAQAQRQHATQPRTRPVASALRRLSSGFRRTVVAALYVLCSRAVHGRHGCRCTCSQSTHWASSALRSDALRSLRGTRLSGQPHSSRRATTALYARLFRRVVLGAARMPVHTCSRSTPSRFIGAAQGVARCVARDRRE